MGIQVASVDILKNGGSGGEGDALKKKHTLDVLQETLAMHSSPK